jgi:hypothetical protein
MRVKCFYCGDPVLPARIELDHFPIPACAGGTETVNACQQCHDLKDRTSWRDLPPEFKEEFMDELREMGRAGRIVFAQFMRTAFEATVAPSIEHSVKISSPELGEIGQVVASEADLATFIARHAYPLLRNNFHVTLKPT